MKKLILLAILIAFNSAIRAQSGDIKAFSKYDFIPGEKIIAFEDFAGTNVGDFPAGWNTNASAEIVTIEGKTGKWLMFTKPGSFSPEFTDKLPDDFTFEFDLLHGVPVNGAGITLVFAQMEKSTGIQNWGGGGAENNVNFTFETAPTGTTEGVIKYSNVINFAGQNGNNGISTMLNDLNNPVHISVWRQKERVRVYANQEKIWDIPKAVTKEAKLNSVIFFMMYAEPGAQHYINNLRLAVGAPDTRNKLMAGKWVTHGILFDVNSANIRAESYGTLKELANVLKENPDLKVKIVGHTDSDGNDVSNLDLSKRRAAAVKAALTSEFGIDESRMQTDGKGESEPIDKNDTPAGKANNRRVEFIKI
jgi:OmpA-OmpF porin, OOP family